MAVSMMGRTTLSPFFRFSHFLGKFDIPVDSKHGEGLRLAGGPADFDGVDLGFGPKAEVEAEVAARVIARSAADFVDPDTVLSVKSNSGSDGVAVGVGPG